MSRILQRLIDLDPLMVVLGIESNLVKNSAEHRMFVFVNLLWSLYYLKKKSYTKT